MVRLRTTHRVAVIAFDDVIVADLVLPAEVLGRAQLADGHRPYEVLIASERATVDAKLFTVRPPWRLDVLRLADTIVVPGRNDPFAATPPAVLAALCEAARRGARVVSICVGAFILAEAGLLDGGRATTHWAAAGELARRYPAVEVDENVLYVDNGQILTSAGAAAGFDVLLHLVERDHGHAVAADTARAVVMPLVRQGGQAQFIPARPAGRDTAGLAPLLEWLDTNQHLPLTLGDIARQAAMSTRTLNRRFQDELGTTPGKWLCRARVRRAQQLLETTDERIESVARLAGFGSPATFRAHFTSAVGTSPRAYRTSFRTAHPSP